jgi:hypothetical protein
MSSLEKVKILYHYSLLDDIVLFGKNKDMYFICVITKIPKEFKKKFYSQNEARIYIQNNDESYYCIQVSLLTDSNKHNKPLNEWFVSLLKKHTTDVYKNLINNSSKLKVKEKKSEFLYFLYDIPAYIWCVVTGMIITEL